MEHRTNLLKEDIASLEARLAEKKDLESRLAKSESALAASVSNYTAAEARTLL